MKLMLGLLSAISVVIGTGVTVDAPIARGTSCANGEVNPGPGSTYFLCVTGQWVHVDRQLCIDYPETPYCAVGVAPTSDYATPAPLVPPAVVPPPPAYIPSAPYIPIPDVPSVPNFNVPGFGCTWVDGYTKKNGTRVRGHLRC